MTRVIHGVGQIEAGLERFDGNAYEIIVGGRRCIEDFGPQLYDETSVFNPDATRFRLTSTIQGETSRLQSGLVVCVEKAIGVYVPEKYWGSSLVTIQTWDEDGGHARFFGPQATRFAGSKRRLAAFGLHQIVNGIQDVKQDKVLSDLYAREKIKRAEHNTPEARAREREIEGGVSRAMSEAGPLLTPDGQLDRDAFYRLASKLLGIELRPPKD